MKNNLTDPYTTSLCTISAKHDVYDDWILEQQQLLWQHTTMVDQFLVITRLIRCVTPSIQSYTASVNRLFQMYEQCIAILILVFCSLSIMTIVLCLAKQKSALWWRPPVIVVLYFKTPSVLFFFQSEGSVRLTYVSNTSNGEHIFSQFSSLSISRLLLGYTSTFIKVACNLLDLTTKMLPSAFGSWRQIRYFYVLGHQLFVMHANKDKVEDSVNLDS